MFGCFRKTEANDPEIFLAAAVTILAEYPRSIIDYVTDPRTGIPSEQIFPPNPYEIREACKRAERRLEPNNKPWIDAPDRPVNRNGRLSYNELKAKYGDGKGTWGIDPEEKPTEITETKPNTSRRYTYAEFVQWAQDNAKPVRPIGRFEAK
jgi:hypothetical protein